jgi:hypothetical protein
LKRPARMITVPSTKRKVPAAPLMLSLRITQK